jgi:HEAT repeat protein
MRRWLLLAALLASLPSAAPAEVDEARVRSLLGDYGRFEELREMGPEVLPVLAGLYETASVEDRVHIARTFYRLGWPSADAKRVLMPDVRTDHENLRLQVQWALGRVSADGDVVEVLLHNMQNDHNPLFRDKAACALAYDQIHLEPHQQLRLLEGLIEALDDPKPQVRSIALKALKIQTGQDKGFDPLAQPRERSRSLRAWRQWLDEYAANL